MGARKLQLQELAIRNIRVDHSLQSRVEMNGDTVKEYADALVAGDSARGRYDFPPVVVFFDGRVNWLADGFHRVAAYKRAGRVSIPTDLRGGTKRDAMLWSISANLKMGLRPTPADRKKAVFMLLVDSEGFEMSATDIGRRCGLGVTAVRRYRSEFCLERGLALPDFVHRGCGKPGEFVKVKRVSKKNNGEPSYHAIDRGTYSDATTWIGGKPIYLGPDCPETRAAFDAQLVERRGMKTILADTSKFCGWLASKRVSSRTSGNRGNSRFCGFVLPGAVGTVCLDFDCGSIYQSVGRVLLFRRSVLPEGRMIVVGLLDEATDNVRELIALANQEGIEFLTPEEVVERFAPRPDAPGGEGDR